MTNEKDGWQEWSKFVLKELERLNKNYHQLYEKINGNINQRATDCPYRHTIRDLKQADKEQDKVIRQIELKFAKWTGYGVVILTVLNLLFPVIKTKLSGG